MTTFARRHALALILLFGLAVRIPLMLMPGTEDMYPFRMWGAQGLRNGILNIYSLSDSEVLSGLMLMRQGIPFHPHAKNATDLGTVYGVPDYPPGNLLTLEVSVALCKFLQGGVLRAGPILNACLNLGPLLAALATAVAVWFFTKGEQAPHPLRAVSFLWLNPALILTSPLLGLQDPVFTFFSFLSLLLFFRRHYSWCVVSMALGCIIKPQGLFVVPVVAAALWADGGWKTFWRFGLRFAFVGSLFLLPYILAGKFLGMVAGVYEQIMFPALSGEQLNPWWLVGAATNALSTHSWSVLRHELSMVDRAQFISFFGFNPLWIGLPTFLFFTGLNFRLLYKQIREGNRWAIFWAAAIEIFGYNMLMIYTHENHLFALFIYLAPLIALADQLFMRIYSVLSAIYAANLLIFDGLGQGLWEFPHWLRTLPGFDVTLLVVVANVGILGWLLIGKKMWFNHVHMTPSSVDRAG